ncbi:MAG: hypothetical protein WDO24_08070 [Pseudomonadota bacterium]
MIDQGTLALVDNQIDAATGTIRLKATFANRGNALWPGEAVSARVVVGMRHGAVTVPGTGRAARSRRAPMSTSSSPTRPPRCVGQDLPDPRRRRRDRAGVAVGERVVIDGQYKLRPGIRVEVTLQDAPKIVRNG